MSKALETRELEIIVEVTHEEELEIDAKCSDIAPTVIEVQVPGIQGPEGEKGADGKDGKDGKDGEPGKDGSANVEIIDNSLIDNLF